MPRLRVSENIDATRHHEGSPRAGMMRGNYRGVPNVADAQFFLTLPRD
jgi:hypothetical protein